MKKEKNLLKLEPREDIKWIYMNDEPDYDKNSKKDLSHINMVAYLNEVKDALEKEVCFLKHEIQKMKILNKRLSDENEYMQGVIEKQSSKIELLELKLNYEKYGEF